jgi:hypothetical protein
VTPARGNEKKKFLTVPMSVFLICESGFKIHLLKNLLGCSYRIPVPDFFSYPGSRIQGSKKHRIPDPDPQHWKKYMYMVGTGTDLFVEFNKIGVVYE